MNNFITTESLFNDLDMENIRFIDCRFQLGNPDFGMEQYKRSHIPGAIYFHLEKDLSGGVAEHGGRHPLPRIEDFQALLEKAGISNHTTVVAYDGGEGSFAARLWWLLKYVGHEKVYILDGGFEKWMYERYPVNSFVPTYPKGAYDINIQRELLATMEDVKKAIHDERVTLIDSRARNRYLGVEEHIDKKAGHIPTSINRDWMESFQNGKFKSPSEQAKRFEGLGKEQPLIVYCGSGITATPNYIALQEAGYTNVKLYAGSFSDWISYDENEIETGD